jgi:hypothetical protein
MRKITKFLLCTWNSREDKKGNAKHFLVLQAPEDDHTALIMWK